MILMTFDIRYRDDRDVILIENVALLSHHLDYSWINLVLRMFSFFICDLGIYCFSWSRGYIQCFMIGSWLFQLFSYRGWVIVRADSLI